MNISKVWEAPVKLTWKVICYETSRNSYVMENRDSLEVIIANILLGRYSKIKAIFRGESVGTTNQGLIDSEPGSFWITVGGTLAERAAINGYVSKESEDNKEYIESWGRHLVAKLRHFNTDKDQCDSAFKVARFAESLHKAFPLAISNVE